jgi:hypothetical protein
VPRVDAHETAVGASLFGPFPILLLAVPQSFDLLATAWRLLPRITHAALPFNNARVDARWEITAAAAKLVLDLTGDARVTIEMPATARPTLRVVHDAAVRASMELMTVGFFADPAGVSALISTWAQNGNISAAFAPGLFTSVAVTPLGAV